MTSPTRSAATRLGITTTEYDERTANGLKWCCGCKAWHDRSLFNADRSRGDGLAAKCRDFPGRRRGTGGAAWAPRPRRDSSGAWLTCERDGCRYKVLAQGLCSRHYQRRATDGRPSDDRSRNRWAERNPTWLGDTAGYSAFHTRVKRRRGMPSKCDRCGTTNPRNRYEWANLTGHYEDVDDYQRMCTTCHRRYDAARRPRKAIAHGTPAGKQAHVRRGEQPCDLCRLAWNQYARSMYARRR